MALEYLLDSRRSFGPGLLLDRPGALMEVAAPADRKTALLAAWREHAHRIAARIGWQGIQVATRDHGATQLLGLAGPVDLLLTATYVAEQAWEAALAMVAGTAPPDLDAVADRLLSRAAEEAKPRLVALWQAALPRDVELSLSDKELILGEGRTALALRLDDLPLPDEIDWSKRPRRIPIVLITGTNGKTTTTRLLARMFQEAGIVAGLSSTDAIQIGAEVVDRDDYAGPMGARRVLRDERVQAAVLETARGGILRRGINVRLADAAIVTNVASDHLHDMGIHSISQMATTKFTLHKALKPGAPLIANAENPPSVRQIERLDHPVIWFALTPGALRAVRRIGRPLGALTVQRGVVRYQLGRRRGELLPAAEIALSYGGHAPHNLANALAASAAALHLGLPEAAIAAALRAFGRRPEDNPGRSNVYSWRGARVIVDFAHNPDSLRSMLHLAQSFAPRRLWVVMGQAGDRSDRDIELLAREVARAHPHRVIVKELPKYLRGRAPGEIPRLIARRLGKEGLDPERIVLAADEATAVRALLAGIDAGDVGLLLVHEDHAGAVAALTESA